MRERPRAASSAVALVPDDADEARVVGAPRYQTTSPLRAPAFEVPILALPATASSPGVLDLWISGTRAARLIRGQESYQPADGRPFLTLPAVFEALVARRDRGGNDTADAQHVRVLDTRSEVVAVYSASTGERLAGPLDSSKPWILVLAPGAKLHGVNADVVPYGEGTLAYLSAPWTAVRVMVDGQVVWEAHVGASSPARTQAIPANVSPGLDVQRLGAWVAIAPEEEVDCGELAATLARVRWPAGWEYATLVDGERTVRKDPKRAAHFSQLAGYGEPLWLVQGHSVVMPGRQTVSLVGSVTDHGVVHSLEGDMLRFRSALAWNDTFRVVLWLRDGRVVPVEARAEGSSEATEAVRLTLPDQDEPRAAAVAYGAARLGAWWSSTWSEELPEAPGDVFRSLTVARWMKLPVTANPHREHLGQLAGKHLAEAYCAWLRPPPPVELDGIEIVMRHSPAWSNAARAVLYDCAIDGSNVAAVERALRDTEPLDFARSYKGLTGVGARQRLPRFLLLELGPQPVVGYHGGPGGDMAKMSIWYYLGLDGAPVYGQQVRAKANRALLADAQAELQVDAPMLRQLVKHTERWESSRCALTSEGFRVYASCRRLDPAAR